MMILRLTGLAFLALMAFPLSFLARRYGRRPSMVLAAVLCSPLVLVQLVGGAHNETFMLLPLVTGVAVSVAGLEDPTNSSRRRWGLVLAGVALCGVAGAVKAPALIAAAILGWLAAPKGDTRRALLASAAATTVAVATVVVIGIATGLGLGWIDNLDVPRKITTVFAPFDAVGVLVMNGLLHLGWTVYPGRRVPNGRFGRRRRRRRRVRHEERPPPAAHRTGSSVARAGLHVAGRVGVVPDVGFRVRRPSGGAGVDAGGRRRREPHGDAPRSGGTRRQRPSDHECPARPCGRGGGRGRRRAGTWALAPAGRATDRCGQPCPPRDRDAGCVRMTGPAIRAAR